MTVYYYIAKKNPKEAIQLLVSEGYQFKMPQTAKELSDLLKQYVNSEGKSGLEKLSYIHPDKQLISEFVETNEEFMNASGCGCGAKMSFDASESSRPIMGFNGSRNKCNCRNCKYNNFNESDCGCEKISEKNSICNCGKDANFNSFLGQNSADSADRTLKLAIGAGILLISIGVVYKLVRS
jgi:hypothetical protein